MIPDIWTKEDDLANVSRPANRPRAKQARPRPVKAESGPGLPWGGGVPATVGEVRMATVRVAVQAQIRALNIRTRASR